MIEKEEEEVAPAVLWLLSTNSFKGNKVTSKPGFYLPPINVKTINQMRTCAKARMKM